MTDEGTGARFPTTRWSRVIAAGARAEPGGTDALADLCAAYWFPVYAFIRRKGHPPDAALDLTQGFFSRLLERRTLAAADPARGRFRAFLRTDVAFFLADARDRGAALKRGGGVRFVPLDAEGRYAAEPADGLTPERLFDRQWALSLLALVVDRLHDEYAASGKSATFEALKFVLADDPRAVPRAELARTLGTTEGAVHRLRKRYRALLQEEIASTLDSPDEVDDEIGALFVALG